MSRRTFNLLGQRFGMLEVIKMVKNEKRADCPRWLCKCDCGKDVVFLSKNLRSGNNISCGCKSRRGIRHGLRATPTYNTWYSMLERCRNPKNASWRYYGAKGISVCQEWNELANFIRDMGMRPARMTLDRIDCRGNYEPSNCRWAFELDQQRNRSNVKCTMEIATSIRSGAYAGLTNRQIADKFGFDPSTVSRIKTGEVWA